MAALEPGRPGLPVEQPVAARERAGAEPAGLDAGDEAAGGRDACDLVRERELASDATRWVDYVPALQALVPAEFDVAAFVAEIVADVPTTPSFMARLDQLFDAVDAHCDQDPLAEQCRSLTVIALTDALGWAARSDDPAEIETGFAVATANWRDLRDRVAGDDLRRAVDANLRFLTDAGAALAAVGWGPDRLDVLEPLEDQIVALAELEVIEPLYELEAQCGFH